MYGYIYSGILFQLPNHTHFSLTEKKHLPMSTFSDAMEQDQESGNQQYSMRMNGKTNKATYVEDCQGNMKRVCVHCQIQKSKPIPSQNGQMNYFITFDLFSEDIKSPTCPFAEFQSSLIPHGQLLTARDVIPNDDEIGIRIKNKSTFLIEEIHDVLIQLVCYRLKKMFDHYEFLETQFRYFTVLHGYKSMPHEKKEEIGKNIYQIVKRRRIQ